jgi:hypothetical protein
VSALFAAGWHFPLWMMLSNQLLAFSLNFIGFTVFVQNKIANVSVGRRPLGPTDRF